MATRPPTHPERPRFRGTDDEHTAVPAHRRTPVHGTAPPPTTEARKRELERGEIVNVLFSFGWLTVHEISFYSDIRAMRVRDLLEEDASGLLADGTVSKRSRTEVRGRVTRARVEYTVFPY